jgi:hypothetical protein
MPDKNKDEICEFPHFNETLAKLAVSEKNQLNLSKRSYS